MTIFSDFAKALAQLGDKNFTLVLVKSLGLSALLFVGVYYGVTHTAIALLPGSITLPWAGTIPIGDWFSGIAFTGVLALAFFLMFPVAMLFIGFFLEDIAAAVEAKYYPDLPPVAPLGMGAILRESIRLFVLMVVLNVVALGIYFASTLLAPVIFWLINGYLLGREYFQLVAMRRIGLKAADTLRKQHRWQIWLAGILMAIPLSVPVLNLLIPILGVATFTHQFHRLNTKTSRR